jgi:hypothetical protein
MLMKKLTMTLAGAATLALVGFAATPAFAVSGPTLPANDKLYVMECDVRVTSLQLFGVDPESGVATEIGTGNPGESTCAWQGAQMPGTDWFYYFAQDRYLQRVNLTTGANEVIGKLSLNGDPYNGGYSLAIGPDGTAYVLDYDDLYTVDVSTAALTYLSSPNFYDEYSGYPYAFAYDYTTEKFYVVEDGDGALYELAPSTGDKVELSYNEDYDVYSISFDANGDMWANGNGNYVSKTTIANFGDSAAWQDSPIVLSGTQEFYSESLWVTPKFPAQDDSTPELANTGLNVAGFAALAGLLTIAGVSIVAVRRRA